MTEETMIRRVVRRIVDADIKALNKVLESDAIPDVEYRKKLEDDLFNKAYGDFLKLKEM